ncbi:MAG TPA: cytochrome c oxidase subunit II [Burkholderiales bacterium]|nr:cytochrome c oxidase subunit II [Burkholderiales bacterium]
MAMENPRRELALIGSAPGFSVLLKRNRSISPSALAMGRRAARRAATGALAVLAAAFSGFAMGLEWNLQPAVTKIAADIHGLHEYVMVLVTVIFAGVFGFMFWSVYAHRKDKGHKAEQFHENTTVETIWTVIPAIILIVIAWPATRVVVAQKDTSNPDLTIKVTGYQWRWGYDYIKGEGEGISFISTLATPREQIEGRAPKGEHYLLEVDNEMIVPIRRKVRVLTTAADVIHSWWIPAFGAKQDAIPGLVRDLHFKAEKTGVYRGQCVELCGKEHGFMPIVVRVVTQDEYTKWVGGKKKAMAAAADDPNRTYSLDELKSRGEKVYAANCVACHQASGRGTPPAFPPLDGSKLVTGPKEAQADVVLNGRPNTAMAAFGKQLNDVELAAVITFTRNNWGNKTGDLVQPAEVKALRK